MEQVAYYLPAVACVIQGTLMLHLHNTGQMFDRLKIRTFRCSVHTEPP